MVIDIQNFYFHNFDDALMHKRIAAYSVGKEFSMSSIANNPFVAKSNMDMHYCPLFYMDNLQC